MHLKMVGHFLCFRDTMRLLFGPPLSGLLGTHNDRVTLCDLIYLGSEPTPGQGIFIVTGIAKCFKKEI